MLTQELEGLQQGIALLADLTQWAVHTPTPGPRAAPASLLGRLRESLQAGLQGGAQGVWQNSSKQLMLWLLEAEHKVSSQLPLCHASASYLCGVFAKSPCYFGLAACTRLLLLLLLPCQ